MKKNKMMRLASILLVLVLMTSSVVGGTFAKYTTSVDSKDNARVANWGFEPVAMNITDLFSNAYDLNAGKYAVEAAVDVIAPGTAGSSTFAFAYDETNSAPEVAYTFVVSTDGSKCHADIQANENIQWKLDNGAWGTWTQLINAIEAMDGDKTYMPGELPVGFTGADETHTISWQWIFETSDAMNKEDTDMGNANFLADVELIISITATQVDTV